MTRLDTPASHRSQRHLDGLAAGASALCLVHCLAMPLVLTTLPVLATSLFASESFHAWMLMWVLPSSALALWVGLQRHGDRAVMLTVLLGLVLLTTAGVRGEEWFGQAAERWVSVGGSLLVMYGHWRNVRRSREICQTGARPVSDAGRDQRER